MGQVKHPTHYLKEGRKECWDEFIDRFGEKHTRDWCLLTAEKYLYRAGYKDGESKEKDLAKANDYIEKAKEITEGCSMLNVEARIFKTVEEDYAKATAQ